uniref:Urocanate hydratase n=1 Tax=Heterorhabditis bacteriophora TaxID=37862 RepID=A0A1I7XRZ9_HETBA
MSKLNCQLAIRNILRYVPADYHEFLAKEFAEELELYGHIYAFRFMPNFHLKGVRRLFKAPSLFEISANSQQAAAIILMILNNLDSDVAQFPQELVTYGGNGQVFSNWIQFRLVLIYLSQMTSSQTLVMYSGHPLGLFPSHPNAPRMTITNGMMISNYSTKPLYDKFFALGVTQYGQMTAGSYCYIGPQGIVHGTTITIVNAGRRYLQVDNLGGKVFVTAGLGGMSGAQPKAAKIAGCIGVIAEALQKRYDQGWLDMYSDDLSSIIDFIRKHRENQQAVSIGYLGNVVDLW